jgi:xanthine dehydrogenase accessory factor
VSDWLSALGRHRASGARAVLVSIVSSKGSVPREPGTRMVVTASTVDGTIGGGHLELQAIGIARDLLASCGTTGGELKRFPLGASLGQCCGGVANLLFETIDADATWVDLLLSLRSERRPVVVATTASKATTGKLLVTAEVCHGSLGEAALDANIAAEAREMLGSGSWVRLVHAEPGSPAREGPVFLETLRDPDFRIVLFGAGHVGRALVGMLAGIPCRVLWVDSRETEFPAHIPANVTMVVTDAPEAEVESAPPGAYFLVMTHSHALDQALAESILHRTDFAYFGLIGSLSKRQQFERRMAARGMPSQRFADMTCPIGVPGIRGKEPATIAVAVAAQLLQVRARAATAGQPCRTLTHG